MYHSNQSGIPNMLYIINNCIAHISINTIIILPKSGITNHQLLTFHQYLTNVFFINSTIRFHSFTILFDFIYILNCFFLCTTYCNKVVIEVNLLSSLFKFSFNNNCFNILPLSYIITINWFAIIECTDSYVWNLIST